MPSSRLLIPITKSARSAAASIRLNKFAGPGLPALRLLHFKLEADIHRISGSCVHRIWLSRALISFLGLGDAVAEFKPQRREVRERCTGDALTLLSININFHTVVGFCKCGELVWQQDCKEVSAGD